MKVFLILAATVGLSAYVHFGAAEASVEDLQPARAASSDAGVRHARTTFAQMASADAGFADLAREGVYTVFIVSSKRCPPCRTLEQRLPTLLAARPDVVVMTVDVTSGARVQHPDAAQVASTPHVAIYGPDQGAVVAQDVGGDKSGYRLLLEWLDSIS